MWPFNSAPKEWRAIVDGKRSGQANLVNETAKQLGEAAADDKALSAFLSASATDIVRHIQNEDEGWTATNVLRAYIQRAIATHKKNNCLTEILFAQALAEAEELDREFQATKKIRGPLHGVPTSVKDVYNVKGFDSTIGYTSFANKPADEDAYLVQLIRKSGGILIGKTNVPQAVFTTECANPLWGCTLNSWSAAHTSGGSSGGEAVLLASDAVALGWGNDIGGSLRTPAHFSGVYSLKPGSGRICRQGCTMPTPGWTGIADVCGPMGRSVSDIELACRATFGNGPSGPYAIPPMPYRDLTLSAKLRIGYYISDDFVQTSPACQRAVLEVVAALRKQGHECIEFMPPRLWEGLVLYSEISSADGYGTLMSHLGHDPLDPSLLIFKYMPKLPDFLRSFIAWAAEAFTGDKIFPKLIRASKIKPVGELWKSFFKTTNYHIEFQKEVWDAKNLDFIIAPPSASPAIPHGANKDVAALAGATLLYSLLDTPVGTISVSRVDPAKDQLTEEWRALRASHGGSTILQSKLYDGPNAIYNPEKMKGLPVGVQVVGKKWEDEKVVAFMHVIDKALGPRGFGPGHGAR
ncbi:hypothetical protein BOTBODRAFT_36230 [Botryobasidium botryosum FD-172 SS1]|uniref:amidase n=1 Tax=Botryobasidium botryosum (strain FD-172 SS1) TaxID=930990 RepID=A0A067M3L8_BOTB1|nr:hypothetical protein BOTBODRAFT_36230 [Botryobasidium botryosum FD-172 SS1]